MAHISVYDTPPIINTIIIGLFSKSSSYCFPYLNLKDLTFFCFFLTGNFSPFGKVITPSFLLI